jgi:hypothetical protein
LDIHFLQNYYVLLLFCNEVVVFIVITNT